MLRPNRAVEIPIMAFMDGFIGMQAIKNMFLLIAALTFLPMTTAFSWDKVIDGDLSLHITEFATIPNQTNGTPPKLNNMNFADGRLFVVDSHSAKIYDITNGAVQLWFDVADALNDPLLLSSSPEGGVRAIAFHPDFTTNGKFYTSQQEIRPSDFQNYDYLSDANNPIQTDSVVREWTQLTDGSFSASREVLRIGVPGPHVIKQIIFNQHAQPGDADYGLLYIAHGDGGHWQSPRGGHNNDALGKILRINPLQSGTSAYTVPSDNPFVSTSEMLDEVYAIGFRSPHNLAFTSSGQLIAAGIGNRNVEEINLVHPGADYGWKEREGSYIYLEPLRGDAGITTLPIDDHLLGYTYPAAEVKHNPSYDGAIAIAGGYAVENGTELSNHYFYAEFASTGEMYYSNLDDMTAAVTSGPVSELSQATTYRPTLFFDHDSNPTTPEILKSSMLDIFNDSPNYPANGTRADIRFGQGPGGELYVTSKQNNTVYLVTNSLPPVDSDGDGLIGANDYFPFDPDNDIDGDGISGHIDNCPNISNPSQEDIDHDRSGDACDPVVNEPTPAFMAQIESVATGLCIGISSGNNNADSHICESDEASQRIRFFLVQGTASTSQSFLDQETTSTYVLQFLHSGQCLTVPGNSTSRGTSLLQQPCDGSMSQQFRVEEDGLYNVIYTGNGTIDLVVDSHGQTDNIIQWEDFGNSNQRWSFILHNDTDTTIAGETGSNPFGAGSQPTNTTTPADATTNTDNQSCSGFCNVENFDGLINGSIRTQSDWQTSPPGALDGAIVTDNPPGAFLNKAMMSDPDGVQFRGNAYKPLGLDSIGDGNAGTFFFQIFADDLTNTYSHIGLSDLDSPRLDDGGTGVTDIFTDFEVQFSLREGKMRVKDGQQSSDITNIDAQNRTMYNVWLAVDNLSDTYEVYIQGGSHSIPIKAEANGRSVFNFRNGSANNDLKTFLFQNSPNVHTGRVFFDNLYVDPYDHNLSNPVSSYTEVDSFEALTVGNLDNRNGWSTSSNDVGISQDPADNENHVLSIQGSDANVSKSLPSIENNTTGTLFFRMRRDGQVNSSTGLSDLAQPTNFNAFENQVNVQNSLNLNLRDGNSFTAVDTFDEDTWYCVWLVSNNTTDTYRAYMKGGALDQATLLESNNGQTDFNYRNGTESTISTFFARYLNSSGRFYLDDIYVDNNGENLSMPTSNKCATDIDVAAPLDDPIPETITKSGLSVQLHEFTTIPASSNGAPGTRINFLHHANEDRDRLFVNDLRNNLYVIENGITSIYLDLSEQFADFTLEPRLGTGFGFFTFHPDFANNGKFYTVHTEAGNALFTKTANYTSAGDSESVHGVITEWTSTNPSASVFVGSMREVLRIGFDTFLHGIQQIGFNPNAQPGSSDYGLLYIAAGDGEENPNFTNTPLDLSVAQGKILRIDPLGMTGPNGQYGIPESNPFLSTEGVLGEIWAYGLRNPHRFSWDTGGINKMFIGHIGEKNIDSVYPGIAGANYGWNEREGSFLFRKDDPNVVYPLPANDAQFGYTYPVAEYDHDEGFALVGGFVYRGSAIPSLQGKYVFGDVVNGRIFYAEEADMVSGQPLATIHELTLLDNNGAEKSMKEFASASRADLRFGIDNQNEIYVLSKQNGKIWQIVNSDSGDDDQVNLPIDTPDTSAPAVTFKPFLTDPTGDTVVSGTSSDNVAIDRNRLLIRNLDTGQYWNGSTWTDTWSWFAPNGTSNWSYAVSLTTSNYRVVAWTWDSSNNPGDIASVSYSNLPNDTIAPVVAFNPTTTNSTGQTTFSGTASDNVAIDRNRLLIRNSDTDQYWNGSAWTDTWSWIIPNGTDNWSYTVSLTASNYRVVAWTWDSSNNPANVVSMSYSNFPSDTIAPVVAFKPITTNSTGQTTLSGTASDNVAVDRNRLLIRNSDTGQYWNGSAWTDAWSWFAPSGTGNWSYTVSLTASNYRLVAWTWDTSNNISESLSTSFSTQ